MQNNKAWFWVIAVFMAVGSYLIMKFSVVYLPVSQGNIGVELFVTLLIFFLGLGVPYWIMKLGAHAAHEGNPAEKEIELKNFGKDQDQL